MVSIWSQQSFWQKLAWCTAQLAIKSKHKWIPWCLIPIDIIQQSDNLSVQNAVLANNNALVSSSYWGKKMTTPTKQEGSIQGYCYSSRIDWFLLNPNNNFIMHHDIITNQILSRMHIQYLSSILFRVATKSTTEKHTVDHATNKSVNLVSYQLYWHPINNWNAVWWWIPTTQAHWSTKVVVPRFYYRWILNAFDKDTYRLEIFRLPVWVWCSHVLLWI